MPPTSPTTCCKAVAGNGIAVGPMLLGAAQPVHILTPSATVRRIVNMTALTAVDSTRCSPGDDPARRPSSGRNRYGDHWRCCVRPATAHARPLYKSLYFQVLCAIVIGVLLGHFYPADRRER